MGLLAGSLALSSLVVGIILFVIGSGKTTNKEQLPFIIPGVILFVIGFFWGIILLASSTKH
jgi:hypothetical protein